MKLAIVTSHPIQYNAPFFRELNNHPAIEPCVFFTQKPEKVLFDPDFNRVVQWDMNLTSGYTSEQHDGTNIPGKRKLLDSIVSAAPDSVLIYGWNFPGHLFLMRKLKGRITIWFRGDSHLIDSMPKWKEFVRKKALTQVYRYVDHCFSVGTLNKEYFLACGVKNERISTAPHAVDNDWFLTHDEERKVSAQKWRQALNINKTEKVILFAGKLEEKKEPELLIHAWQNINMPSCHLIIAGSGILESRLRERYEALPNIHFIGFQNQSKMPILYRMADVFCLPSRGPNETWGLSINEALACGVPSIASSNVGCSPDIFLSDDLGQVFESGNCTALCLALQDQLSKDSPCTESLSSFIHTFSYNRFIDQIVSQCSPTNN